VLRLPTTAPAVSTQLTLCALHSALLGAKVIVSVFDVMQGKYVLRLPTTVPAVSTTFRLFVHCWVQKSLLVCWT
jgi:hypothetical protein